MLDIIKEGFALIKIKKRWYFLFFILTILISTLELLGIGFVFVFLDILLNDNENKKLVESFFINYFGIQEKNKILIYFTTFIIFCFLFRNLILILFELLNYRFAAYLQGKYCSEIFQNYLNKEYSWYIKNDLTQLIINVSQHVNLVVQNVVIGFFVFLSSFIIFISISMTVIFVRPIESFSIILMLLILMLTYFIFIKNTIEYNGNVATKTFEQFFLNVSDPLKSIRLVKTFNLENFFYKRQKFFFDKYLKHSFILNVIKIIPKYLFELIVIVGILSLILFYLLNGYDIVEYIPVFAFFAIASLRLLPHVGAMLNYLQGVKRFKKALFQLSNSIKSNYPNKEKMNSQEFFFESMELKKVKFSYEKNENSLNDINLKINKGEKIAIVGKSGSGKTTLLNIILGLLRPDRGSLLLNGKNSSNVDYTNIFGLLPQESFILNDTFDRNITLSEEKQKKSEIIKVMNITNLGIFFNKKNNKFIRRMSTNFSEGEKQRIGISRVLYSKKKILVFDEPTSSLDSLNEKKIMNLITSLPKTITVLIVTHKLNTLKKFKKIVLLNNMKIDDIGSFDYLYKKNKNFRMMVDFQKIDAQ
tara:strand:+ start:363 stop:2126 length:1764 start_codon:yes stop_codon:yes gene_type:complete